MDWTVTLSIVGVVVAFLQFIMVYQLHDLKSSFKDVWRRLNNHYHEVECNNEACKKLQTGNVIIPRGVE